MLGPGPLIVPQHNPNEPPGRGIQLYIIAIVTLIVAAFFVAARIVTRIQRTQLKLWWDDYCILFALLIDTVLTVTEVEAVVNGYGEHAVDLGPEQTVAALKWFYLAQVFYKVVITFDKLAILLFYLRIFPNKTFRIFTFIGLAIVGATGLAFTLGTIWQCDPLPYFWDRRIAGGHCIPSAPWWISYSSINIFTDVYILLLPVPSLASLSMKIRHKVALIGVFALGSFVCVATIIRMTTLASSAGTDATYDPIPATNWSVIEANVGLICACLPSLKPAFDSLFRFCRRVGSEGGTIFNPYGQSGDLTARGQRLASDAERNAGKESWVGAADNSVSCNHPAKVEHSESQENFFELQQPAPVWGIHKKVDVTVSRTFLDDRKSESASSSGSLDKISPV